MSAKRKTTKREVEWDVEVDHLFWWTVWDSCPTRREAIEVAKGLGRSARVVRVTRDVVLEVLP